jgi:hypothetical protein
VFKLMIMEVNCFDFGLVGFLSVVCVFGVDMMVV